jgi:hypothetical protein
MQEREVGPGVSVSKPLRPPRLFPPTGSIIDGWDAAPIDGCLAARSRRVFGFGLCETVVFQLARVSVGSVRVFISYLEDG